MNHEGYRDPTAEEAIKRIRKAQPGWIKGRLCYRIGELMSFQIAVRALQRHKRAKA